MLPDDSADLAYPLDDQPVNQYFEPKDTLRAPKPQRPWSWTEAHMRIPVHYPKPKKL